VVSIIFLSHQKIQAQYCSTCHEEHTGKRITNDLQFCKHCHEKLSIKNDPLDIPHTKLIEDKRWPSCLGCHDYHGNHVYKIPTHSTEIIPELKVIQYFQGLPSPYAKEKKHEARKRKEK